jgi:hypothetical protein
MIVACPEAARDVAGFQLEFSSFKEKPFPKSGGLP